jgi:hypothetical protein
MKSFFLGKCKKEKIKLTVVVAERLNVWNTECKLLNTFLTEPYVLKYLHPQEIDELLILLETHHSLGTLEFKTREQQVEAFSEKAGRELLVSLYEAINSKPFEDIIFDEYKSIDD